MGGGANSGVTRRREGGDGEFTEREGRRETLEGRQPTRNPNASPERQGRKEGEGGLGARENKPARNEVAAADLDERQTEKGGRKL